MQPIGFTTGIPQKDGPDFVIMAIGSVAAQEGQRSHYGPFATRHQVFDFLADKLPLEAIDEQPYRSDAERGANIPRWEKFLEFGVIKLMQDGLLVRTGRRLEWSQDGRTEFAGGGDEDDSADEGVLTLTGAGQAEYQHVMTRVIRSHWALKTMKAHKW